MLPDLKAFKSKLQRVHMEHVSAIAHAKLGVFAVAPKHIVHEGNSMRTDRADGSVEQSEFFSAQAEVTIAQSDVQSMTEEERAEILQGLGERMATAMSTQLYNSLNQTLEDAGQVVQANGKVASEAIFEMLEKIEMEFDDRGAIKNMCISAGSQAKLAIESAFAEIQSNPELLRRYESILAIKRERWRDKQASRKLVG